MATVGHCFLTRTGPASALRISSRTISTGRSGCSRPSSITARRTAVMSRPMLDRLVWSVASPNFETFVGHRGSGSVFFMPLRFRDPNLPALSAGADAPPFRRGVGLPRSCVSFSINYFSLQREGVSALFLFRASCSPGTSAKRTVANIPARCRRSIICTRRRRSRTRTSKAINSRMSIPKVLPTCRGHRRVAIPPSRSGWRWRLPAS